MPSIVELLELSGLLVALEKAVAARDARIEVLEAGERGVAAGDWSGAPELEHAFVAGFEQAGAEVAA